MVMIYREWEKELYDIIKGIMKLLLSNKFNDQICYKCSQTGGDSDG